MRQKSNILSALFSSGTSPHAVTSVSVDPGISQANVSWEPGFDGGYTQRFTVWWVTSNWMHVQHLIFDKSCNVIQYLFIRIKPTVRGKHEWASIPVPTTKTSLLVTGLQAFTSYQFSVLAQNKLGSGPFSEIVTITTLGEHNGHLLAPNIQTHIYMERFRLSTVTLKVP